MQRKQFAMALCAVLLALSSILTASVTKDDFARYDKQTVVLKDTLYSIAYAMPSMVKATTHPMTKGVTVVSVDKGVYYGGNFIAIGEFADRDPQQLAEKVTSKGGRPGFIASVMSKGSDHMEDGVREAKVLTYKVGSTMTVKRVNVDSKKNRVVVELYDEFTTKGDPSTDLTVEWSGDVTREQVETLISKFLEFKG